MYWIFYLIGIKKGKDLFILSSSWIGNAITALAAEKKQGKNGRHQRKKTSRQLGYLRIKTGSPTLYV